ncbi:SlyX family protein [Terasakiella pusilla]|jgi:SlyX protein|uniref:SlyX family protein n=1 Tax=Terasakiella pusilla TaxID=64973 RepID=UPI0005711903|nr:SlyX family protein [Terasakiella pusilla]
MSIEERITDLEIRLTHQEDTIDDLNKTVFEQWQTIERQGKEIEALKQRLRTFTQAEIDDAPYLPPHY